MHALFAAILLAAAPEPSVPNLVVNPDAESGAVAPWVATGWTARAYGTVPDHDPNNRPGEKGFAADAPGATLVQTVSVSQYASQIDAGEDLGLGFDLYVGGGPGSGGTQATLQPLNGNGDALGAATTLGPPAAGDYYGKAGLLECSKGVTLPPGTRSARITLTAVGQETTSAPALADNVWFGGPYARTLIGREPPPEPADAPNCTRYPPQSSSPSPTPTATPTVSPTVTPSPPGASQLALGRRRVSFLAAVAGRFRVRVERRRDGEWRLRRRVALELEDGDRAVAVFRRLPLGRYRVTVTPPSGDPVVAKFRLR